MSSLPPLRDNPFDKHVAAPPATVGAEAPAPPHTTHRYGNRFVVAFCVLAGLVGAAVTGVVLLATLGGGAAKTTEPWSVWSPRSAAGPDRLREIAEQVAPRYRLDDGKQMVAISSGLPRLEALGVSPDHVRLVVTEPRRGPDGKARTDSTFVDGQAAFFQLCGQGESCALSGTPTVTRGSLLRREALEIALLALRYNPEVSSVVVGMPPFVDRSSPTQATVNTAVLFPREAFAAQLTRPLSSTLPGRPPRPRAFVQKEQDRIDALTLARTYVVGDLVPTSIDSTLILRLNRTG